ncbi:MAG: UvrD-helicase domain-containing protein [Myxococcota bacterium]
MSAPLVDQRARDAAVAERARNLIVDAGAGTGKTSLLVRRLVAMVAPDDGAPPVDLTRIAAVTFTRKAAGELRLRIRERLLEALADPDTTDGRRERLRHALGALDTAHVGTIHSFADRLLRLRPMEARVSPGFDIAEEPDALVRETLDRLLRGAETHRLEDEVPAALRARADEAEETVLLALEAGVRAEDRDLGYVTFFGLHGLVRQLIDQRDLPLPDVALEDFDRARFDHVRDRVRERVGALAADNRGTWFLRRIANELDAIGPDMPPAQVLRTVRTTLARFGGYKKGNLGQKSFPKDKAGWAAYCACTGAGKTDVDPPLFVQLEAPLRRWLALRLVRMAPVVCALYERVKARHRQVDQLDLLIRLRDLLQGDPSARAFYQGLFDHVFVDEFQDTDPLQAEILMYLCEDGARARSYEDVILRPGKLTLVGDPKQSIYRFRRADVSMYDQVRAQIARQGALEAELETNFRSTPRLLAWLNHRFEAVLGRAEGEARFDPATGRVFQQPLAPGRAAPDGQEGAAVHAVPFPACKKADDTRAAEAGAMARYLRWLVHGSGLHVTDPLTRARRPVGYGDIAVLGVVTSHLPLLFAELDALHVPYASRGGTLFLQDPLHRRFLLALRALSDRSDGVARASLLRPPFFALDPRDLALAEAARRAEQKGAPDGWAPEGDEALASIERVREAEALVAELRNGRFDRGVERTARDLLERTGYARVLAGGPNGEQRLARLRELCFVLGHHAEAHGLDFDATTAEARTWVDDPVQLDPPHPVDAGAVQVLTVHQAKGLEFPVVVLWDGRGKAERRVHGKAFKLDRQARGWLLGLQGFEHEESSAPTPLAATDKEYENAELDRVVYVAATRARDLLVLPKPDADPDPKYIAGKLLEETPPGTVRELAPYGADGIPEPDAWWLHEPGAAPPPREPADLEQSVMDRWAHALPEAARPRFAPTAVTEAAQAGLQDAPAPADETDDRAGARPAWRKPGRFGPTFGITVHRALELLLTARARDTETAVARAARETGLPDHHDEARADVDRTLATLASLGIQPGNGTLLRLEYPVAGVTEEGRLLTGSIDLLARVGDALFVIDFKTDPPPEGSVEETHGAYVEQLRTYGRMVEQAGLTPTETHAGLLFTADGATRWVAGA